MDIHIVFIYIYQPEQLQGCQAATWAAFCA